MNLAYGMCCVGDHNFVLKSVLYRKFISKSIDRKLLDGQVNEFKVFCGINAPLLWCESPAHCPSAGDGWASSRLLWTAHKAVSGSESLAQRMGRGRRLAASVGIPV